MTINKIRSNMRAAIFLTLLVLSSCSLQGPRRSDGAGVDDKPGTSTGITIFGDADWASPSIEAIDGFALAE